MKFEIEVPIYNQSVLFYVDENMDELLDDFPEIGEHLGSEENAFYASHPTCHVLFIRTDNLEFHVIAHEMFHLTCGIARSVGLVYSDESEEGFAYLNGFLTETIYGFLYEENII